MTAHESRYQPLSLETLPLSGPVLIEASAGTGKTFTISTLYLRLVLEAGYRVREILVVTFTDAATRELRDRIRSSLTDALVALNAGTEGANPLIADLLGRAAGDRDTVKQRLTVAVTGFDEAAIFTIHGFCQRMLRDHAFESRLPFETELVVDQRGLIQDVIDDFWRIQVSAASLLDGVLIGYSGITMEVLSDLGQRCLGNPLAVRLPEATPGAREALAKAVETAAGIWAHSRAEIANLLLTDPCLKRSQKTYHTDLIPGLLAALDRFLSGSPDQDGIEAVKRMSAGCIKDNLKGKKIAPEHDFFNVCEDISRHADAYGIACKQAFIAYLFSALEQRKNRSDQISFDDLLSRLAAALDGPDGSVLARSARSRFKAALIDEFQDTDSVQYRIFKKIFASDVMEKGEPRPAFLQIGDPKQAIYGFRGADIFAYIGAATAMPDDATFTLSTNWRSEHGLMAGVNHLFSRLGNNPFALGQKIAFLPVDAAENSKGNQMPLVVDGESPAAVVIDYLAEPPEREGKGLTKDLARSLSLSRTAAEISRLLTDSQAGRIRLGDRPVTASDIAVLVTRNADAAAVKDRLSACRIPAVISKSGSVFETEAAESLMTLMSAVAQPGHVRLRHAALVSPLVGVSALDLAGFLETDAGQAAYERHVSRFAALHQVWLQHGFYAMFRQFLSDYGLRERLLTQPDGERFLTHLLHIAEQLHTAETENRFGVHRLVSWFLEQQTRAGENLEAELRLESDADAVQILTVFKSKGLEYPIVFCPFLWQQSAASGSGIYHNERDEAVIALSPDETARKAREKERLSELMRLLYVALTRSRNRCYLTVGWIGKSGKIQLSALDYLFAGGMPENTPDVIRYFKDRFTGMSDETWADTITQRVADAPEGSIRFRKVETADTPQALQVETADPAALSEKRFTRPGGIPRTWGITSYSRLIEGDPEAHSSGVLSAGTALAPTSTRPLDDFSQFPKGAIPGTCMHSIFETIDFQTFPDPAGKAIITAMLNRYGISPHLAAAVTDKVAAVLHTPLTASDPDLVLHRILPADRLAEMGFFHPVRHLTPEQLKNTFSTCGIPICPDYPDRLGNLSFAAMDGFMQGFIDLMFVFNGKYYLLDWKTNFLGEDPAAYHPDHLTADMAAAHYLLQYHIYTVAAHRYLQSRVPDYDYETHFGGVFYLFIRGMGQGAHPQNGIFFDRPSTALINAFSELNGPLPERTFA